MIKTKKIILLGAPGSGKGTLSQDLLKYNYVQISTGDLFRKKLQEDTREAKEIQAIINRGELIPDSITNNLAKQEILKNIKANKNIILDGYPRTIEQAEELDKILEKRGKKVDLVINLVTPKEEIIDRMLTRRVCTNQDCKATYNTKLHPPKVEGICDLCGSPLKQRADDSDPEAIRKRLEIYEEKTSPLVDYYKNKGVLKTEEISISINRMGTDVAKDIVEGLKND